MDEWIIAIDYLVSGPRTAAAVRRGQSSLRALQYVDQDGRIQVVTHGIAETLNSLGNARRIYCDAVFSRIIEATFNLPLADAFDDVRALALLSGERATTVTAMPYGQAAEIARSYRQLRPAISAEGLDLVYNEIELPVVDPTVMMIAWGLTVDTALLNHRIDQLQTGTDYLQQQINQVAGYHVRLRDHVSLAGYLYGRLQLPVKERTQTGQASTTLHVLERLGGCHPSVPLIAAYLRQSYLLDSCRHLAGKVVHGRVHGQLDPLGAETGRFSCSDPPLQALPADCRDLIIADEGKVLIELDLSQIELRVLAQLSGDPALLQAFHDEVDLHRRTAAALFSIPEDQVTPEQRAIGKRENFAALYGNAPHVFAYAYPTAYGWIEQVRGRALSLSSVRTLYGRRRLLPQVYDPAGMNRALRQAVNAVIQGTAADVLKLLIRRLYTGLDNSVELLMTEHDSVLVQVPAGDVEALLPSMHAIIERPLPRFEVPLRASIRAGQTWSQCKQDVEAVDPGGLAGC